MSNRALRKLHGTDLMSQGVEIDESDEETESKSGKESNRRVNPFELLNAADECPSQEDHDSEKEQNEVQTKEQTDSKSKKKRKKKKKKGKEKQVNEEESLQKEAEDEIDASIREVNQLLNNANIGEDNYGSAAGDVNFNASTSYKTLLSVEHKNLNPETELKRIFGSRVIREEQGSRRRTNTRRKQRATWMAQPKDNWMPIGKTGLTMALKEKKNGYQYFSYEHSSQYQQVQFQFYDAVESLDPQNIGNILQLQPYHIDALIQLSEVFRMSEDMQMAAELIERALYAMEMSFHPLFNMATGQCRLDYRRMENRSLFLALFKHILSLGQRGCNRTALEFCKFLLSLDPDGDPLCTLLMIDYYAIRSEQYDFLVRLFNEWEAHRNLSQLPNFAFSIPLAYFHLEDIEKADDMLQNGLLMFPGVLTPLLDKCSIQPDKSASHSFFKTSNQPEALKQLIALYAGRCFSCWKQPEVVEWLERNVKLVIERVEQNDPLIKDYENRRQTRYNGTPRNIYRHILISEIPSATATIPVDVASTVLSFDPLPPLDNIASYTRPSKPNRAETSANAISMFLRSLLPNFNPNEPAPENEGAVGGREGNQLRQGVGALMDAMRDLLNNIQMAPHPVEGEQEDQEENQEEWD